MDREPVIWEELSTKDIARLLSSGADMVIFPVGSTEQHGAHLPVNVDILCAYEIAKGVSRKTGLPILPPMAYGNSQAHAGFPGTLSLRPETFQKIMEEICLWVRASGFKRILILNGHLSNEYPLQSAVGNLRHNYPDLLIRTINWWNITPEIYKSVRSDVTAPGFHGNNAETSMLLFLRPDLVKMKEAKAEPGRERFFSYAIGQISPTGVIGDPLLASKENGERLYSAAVEALAGMVKKALKETPH